MKSAKVTAWEIYTLLSIDERRLKSLLHMEPDGLYDRKALDTLCILVTSYLTRRDGDLSGLLEFLTTPIVSSQYDLTLFDCVTTRKRQRVEALFGALCEQLQI